MPWLNSNKLIEKLEKNLHGLEGYKLKVRLGSGEGLGQSNTSMKDC